MILIRLLTIIIVACVSRSSSQSNGPVRFVTGFYKTYLNAAKQDYFSAEKRVFSLSALQLLDSNHAVCARKAGTDVCGYDADCDIFLASQENGPDLNFKNSSFRAKLVSPGVVEVSFTVWPGGGAQYKRRLRLSVVRERGRWKLDDITLPDDNGVFKTENSMRFQIKKEIDYYRMY